MENETNQRKTKKLVLKRTLKDGTVIKLPVHEKTSNTKELVLKSVELYEPYTYEQLLHLNKKKYRDLKLNILINHLKIAINEVYKAIDLYRELKNRTEFWEKDLTINFDFDSWNKLKKVNGKLTTYFRDLLEIKNKIEREKNANK